MLKPPRSSSCYNDLNRCRDRLSASAATPSADQADWGRGMQDTPTSQRSMK
jgi:hypothetical protein